MKSTRLARLTPATLLMALMTAYVYAQEAPFDLLQALKKPKKGGEDSSEQVKEKKSQLEADAGEEEKATINLVPINPQKIVQEVEEAAGEIVEKMMDDGRINNASSLVGAQDESLISLPYYEAYHRAIETGRSMAVFVVRTDDKDIVKKINEAVARWEAAGFRRFLNIAIIGPKNPNLKSFSAVVRDPQVEMTAYYKRNGKWDTNNYIGVTAVQGIMDRMTKWLDDKDAWEKKQAAEAAKAEKPPRPRDTFNLNLKPLTLVR